METYPAEYLGMRAASSANMILVSILVDSSRAPDILGPLWLGWPGPDWPDRGYCPILPSVCVCVLCGSRLLFHFIFSDLMMLPSLLHLMRLVATTSTLSTNEHFVSLSFLWALCSAHELKAGSEKTVKLANATRTWLWLPSLLGSVRLGIRLRLSCC